LANMASLYACYHGPHGLQAIAQRVHRLTAVLAAGLQRLRLAVEPKIFFDTLRVRIAKGSANRIQTLARSRGMNFREINDDTVGISLDETTSFKDLAAIWSVFNGDRAPDFTPDEIAAHTEDQLPSSFARTTTYLKEAVFNSYHSQTEM